MRRLASRLVLLILAVSIGSLPLAACAPAGLIGTRPSRNVAGSVEAYLQRYQPGPTPRLFQTSRIYDRHGKLLAERWEEGRRTWAPLSRISRHLIDATVATEDATYFSNSGIDPARVAAAALQNAQQGGIVSGGSTITMQLARNLFLGPEQRYDQSMDRKMLEAGLAQELTALFGKDELLEMYFNLLNYGHLTYGPEAAAQIYFGKPAADLTLSEATFLAGIPQRPADLDPYSDLDAARARQRVVLDMMVRHGYLSPVEADAVFADPVALRADPDTQVRLAPHFVQFVEEAWDSRFGEGALRRGGLQITTTLDLEMQNLAQKNVRDQVAGLRTKYDLTNGALVAMRPGSGEILAMVGSADFANASISGQVNVAVSPRQPGSAIKPILYATAFNDNLISPATVLWDVPVTYTTSIDAGTGAPSVYAPANYDGKFHGPVTVRSALANSYNVPAVKLLDVVTVDRMLEAAVGIGIRSFAHGRDWYGLSLTLGGGEVTLLDLTTAFATLASGGLRVEPKAVLVATDSLGRTVETENRAPPTRAVSDAAAFLVTDILSDNEARTPMFGVDSPLRLSRPAAAKTGTTSDWRDNWTVGYTRYLVAGVWAGNADGHPMKNTSGLTGAAPIWHGFMEAVLASPAMLTVLEAPNDPDAPERGWEFAPPADVEQRQECPPGVSCRDGGEYFSSAWLEQAGQAGAVADSVETVASAPVYVDDGRRPIWTAYCSVEPAVSRSLLKLPGRVALPESDEQSTAGSVDRAIEQAAAQERLNALAWVLRHPTPASLGPCEDLAGTASKALALDQHQGSTSLRVMFDMAGAMDPNAGPVAGAPPAQVTAPGIASFVLAEPVSHHDSCPGEYIVGRVMDGSGQPLAGIHIALVDQWGNRADAVSKDGATDYGQYDFPLNHVENEYTLTVVDAQGQAASLPVTVDHLQGSGGDAPCHSVIWRAG